MRSIHYALAVTFFVAALGETLWPIPLAVHLEGSPVALSKDFSIKTSNSSVLLKQGIDRYDKIIQGIPHSDQPTSLRRSEEVRLPDGLRDQSLQSLQVAVISGDESLNSNTSYEYWIHVENMEASVVGQSVYGAIYGMETFSQLIVNGSLLYATVAVHDMPEYVHRGLMIDSGRRFFPIPLVYNLLDAMGYLKMNVLHFHLSDFCRFSVESKLYPQLSASLDGQYYKQDDIVAIVDYARQRGIRVMPEFDFPGHSKGLEALARRFLDFCSDDHREIYGDARNKSLETLQNLLAEMAGLFPEPLFHVGCDETKEVGNCTLEDIKQLEQETLDFVQRGVERTPVAYEEALFRTNAAENFVVIQAWESYTAIDVIQKGNKAIEGQKHHFYLSLHPIVPLSAVWTNIAVNMTAVEKKLLLGGEISFWTDEYCPTFNCWNESDSHHKTPLAPWMSNSAHDSVFSQSVGNMIWPRGIAAAGSFWRFNESLSTSSADFLMNYHAQNQRLIDRGIISCPSNCTCDTLTKCGMPYPHTA